MRAHFKLIPWAIPLLLVACVTVNVYFPAPAVDKVAERMVRDIWGDMEPPPQKSETEPVPAPQSGLSSGQMVTALLDWMVEPAHAGANLNVSTAAIRQVNSRLRARATEKLKPYLFSGAIGIDLNGDLKVRGTALSLREQAKLRRWVSADNRDRATLYREIANANGHPEWAAEIRSRFAAKWASQAKSGWWVQIPSGQWRQK